MKYCGARVGEYLPTGQVGVHACGADSHPFLVLGEKKLQLHKCDRDGCGIVWFDQEPKAKPDYSYSMLHALAGAILEHIEAKLKPRRRRPRRKRRA